MKDCHNIADLRRMAGRRLPRIFSDYIDGGSHSELTLGANESDFARWRLRQHVLRDVSTRDLSATFLGASHALPLMLGPIGFLGMFGRRGEVAAARAAGAAGIPSCVSAFAIRPIDEVARENPASTLYSQLYVLRDRALTETLIARAEAAGAAALFLTVDTAVTPVRERDARNGFRNLTRPTLGQWCNILGRPSWCWAMTRDGKPEVGHARAAGFGRGVMEQAGNLARQIDPGLSWSDVDWLRRRWPRKLVIKGILEPEDARRALDAGADGIVVSNHGGRQLDGASSTIMALPAIAEAVAGRMDVLVDGGFRRGWHIALALALGASAVSVGRPYAWGLAAGGEAGVARAIALLAGELDSTLALMGLSSVAELRAGGGSLVHFN
ncbi:alpha-hydroxy-acid oxidizing protein [Acidisoma cellulosilytica]|uniref:Alpha-hydroxy-acid oxidizing protein n=1 Tax=Acidisoma cellulosilyticum TaxID=2802395 RepID=A0A963Z018_9PROT|nr:alpha-hydroxy acid oxidase [Acidisoma cellulosilyticum]MCB8880221.1 alpha-hydroxy-acid oxidizing protein [Acidisoma cellulosilyticum]